MKVEGKGCGVVGTKMRSVGRGGGWGRGDTINVECHLSNLFSILPLRKSFFSKYFPPY